MYMDTHVYVIMQYTLKYVCGHVCMITWYVRGHVYVMCTHAYVWLCMCMYACADMCGPMYGHVYVYVSVHVSA